MIFARLLLLILVGGVGLFASSIAYSAPLSERAKDKYLERISKFVDLDLIEVEVKDHWEKTAAKPGRKVKLGKIGEVAVLSGKPSQSYLYSIEYTLFLNDTLPAEVDQALKDIAKIVGNSYGPQIVEVNLQRVPAPRAPASAPEPPFQWSEFLTQNQLLIVVSLISVVLLGFILVLYYGITVLKAHLERASKSRRPIFNNFHGNLRTEERPESHQSPQNGQAVTVPEISLRSHPRLFRELKALENEIATVGTSDEEPVYLQVAERGKYRFLKLLALHCLPVSFVFRLPQHLMSHYLSQLGSDIRFNFIASVPAKQREPLLQAFGPKGSPDREIVLFELKRLKGQVDKASAVSAWKNLVEQVRKDVRHEASIRNQVEPLVDDWVSSLKQSWKWRSREKAS